MKKTRGAYIPRQRLERVQLRIPLELKQWYQRQRKHSGFSLNAQIIFSLVDWRRGMLERRLKKHRDKRESQG